MDRATEQSLVDLIQRAADEGRNVWRGDEPMTDDQAMAVEVFASDLLDILDPLYEHEAAETGGRGSPS